jgi:hypothetical protein
MGELGGRRPQRLLAKKAELCVPDISHEVSIWRSPPLGMHARYVPRARDVGTAQGYCCVVACVLLRAPVATRPATTAHALIAL